MTIKPSMRLLLLKDWVRPVFEQKQFSNFEYMEFDMKLNEFGLKNASIEDRQHCKI